MTERATLRQRARTRLVAGFGGILALALSLGMAIMAAARPVPLALAQPDEDIDTGRWRVNVAGARFMPGKPDAAGFLDRQDSLVVEMRLTNLSQRSSNSFGNVVKPEPAVDGLEAPTYLLARDRSMSFDLHPGMPEYVLAVWKWPEGKPAPRKLRLLLEGERYKPRDNLYGAPGWFPAEPMAAVDLPVAAADTETGR